MALAEHALELGRQAERELVGVRVRAHEVLLDRRRLIGSGGMAARP